MTTKVSQFQSFVMKNPLIQFIKFIFLFINISAIVAVDHGGT